MKPSLDDLLSKGAIDPMLARLYDEVIRRLQAGDPPGLTELTRDSPEYAEPIRRLLPALEALADLGASAVRQPARGVSEGGPSAPAPRVLGDYRILREVGRGGMGVVYEAQQRSLNRRVALKVLPLAAALDARQFRRFELEAQAAACLHHNNIVPVFAVGTEGGVPYYAMQYIEGRSLAQVIAELRRVEGLDRADRPPDAGAAPRLEDLTTTALARSLIAGGAAPGRASGPGAVGETEAQPPRLTPDAKPASVSIPASLPRAATGSSTRSRAYARTIVGLGLQAAEALDHAHARGILHRDIKPANLLLDGEGRLWVADFGLAQIQGSPGLTLSGDVLGTLRYMSPEQALGKRVVIDGRTDVYSLGVTLYELLTLRPAFDGRDRQEVLRRIADREPVPPRALNPAVPRDLETIVAKAMAKDPAARYATARDLADDLRNHLEDRPIRARRPNLAERAWRWGRRHRTLAWSAAMAVCVAVLMLAGCVGYVARDRAARRAESEGKVREAVAVLGPGLRRGNPHAADVVRAARQAEAHLGGDLVRDELRGQVRQLLADLAMLAAMERIRLDQAIVKDREFDPRADTAYAAAFRSYGVDVDALSPAGAGALLRDRAIAVHLAAGLDNWAVARKKRGGKLDLGWRRLLEVAAEADPELKGWRAAFRGALAREAPREELERLAGAAPLGALPATTVSLLGNHLRAEGAAEAAVSVLRVGQRRHPADFWVNHILAFALTKLRPAQLDEAIGYFRAALALRPESPQVHSNLGVVLMDKGRLDEAIACFHEAIRLQPDYGCAYNNLGNALKQQGKLDEAIASHKEAVRLGPANHGEHHASLGSNLSDKGRLDEAIACYREALRLEPNDADIHNSLGYTLRKQGKLDEAIPCYAEAIRLKPDLALAHNNLGIALVRVKKGRLDEILAFYKEALRLEPNHLAYDGLGVALANQGRLDEAATCFREAVRLKSDYAGAHSNLGTALLQQGKPDEAIASFKEAVRLKPDYALAHSNLGGALIAKGRVDEAIAACREALRLQPDLAPAHANFGDALQKQGKLDEAIACYHAAIRLQPDNAITHSGLGEALRKQGKLDEAIAACREALRLQPDYGCAYNNLGIALYEQGKLGEAVAALKEAVRLGPPNHADHHDNLRIALKEQGKLDEAAEAEALMGPVELPADVFARP